LPDTSPTCSSYSLPVLPSGYSYACASQNNYRKVDGNGWIPINFSLDSTSKYFTQLPIDPLNNNVYYYTYFPGGSFELTALLTKPRSASLNDGGYGTQTYETGYASRTKHTPLIREPSLVGY
jgi:hypothetical protein